MHKFHVILASVLDIYRDIVQLYNNRNIKIFDKDLVDITLETGQSVR